MTDQCYKRGAPAAPNGECEACGGGPCPELSYTVEVEVQIEAMLKELVKIGVHGESEREVLAQLALDQLKYLCGSPGFGPDLLSAADNAAKKVEAARRPTIPMAVWPAPNKENGERISPPLPAGCTCTLPVARCSLGLHLRPEQVELYIEGRGNLDPTCPVHRTDRR